MRQVEQLKSLAIHVTGECFVLHISIVLYFDPFAILQARQIANDICGLNK